MDVGVFFLVLVEVIQSPSMLPNAGLLIYITEVKILSTPYQEDYKSL